MPDSGRGNYSYSVATDEDRAELPGDIPGRRALFAVVQDYVDVDIERLEITDDLPAVLQLDDDTLVPRVVESV